MKLTKISYGSAVFFGAFSFVMYLFLGFVQWGLRDELMIQGVQVTLLQAFVMAPIAGGVLGYLMFLLMITIYNLVAKRYPITWEIKK